MKSTVLKVTRNLSLTLIAMSLVSLGAHAKPPHDKDRASKRNSNTTISISVEGGYASITSGKEISHVIIWYCDPMTQVKYEEAELLPHLDSDGKTATFSGAPIMTVAAKSGTSTEMYMTQCPNDDPNGDPR